MVGAMVMSMIADKIGRKPIFLGSIVAISILGFATAWVNSYIAFSILRFFIGFFQQVCPCHYLLE